MKRLYRSETNKVVAGVLGGIGEYANIDPVILRAGYVALCIFTALIPGIITYFILTIIIPRKVKIEAESASYTEKKVDDNPEQNLSSEEIKKED